jgi:uncharacterized protein (TIGR01655 family)
LKKLGIFIASLLIIGGASFTWYSIDYGGSYYYAKILDDGTKKVSTTQVDKIWYTFSYQEEAYSENGKVKSINFTANRNLRHGAYLRLTYNYRKGVTKWEEVKKSDIPEKALNNLKMEELENS